MAHPGRGGGKEKTAPGPSTAGSNGSRSRQTEIAHRFATSASPEQPILLSALEYEYNAITLAELVALRAPHRAAHLALANKWQSDGRLIMGGAFTGEPLRGLLVFKCDKTQAATFASSDPYVLGGVVKKWRVRTWNVVVGSIPT